MTVMGFLALFLVHSASASELVYTPVNPAFGGNPANGNWLLANAQAQNNHVEDKVAKTPGEIFNETLERLLVRSAATSIVNLLDSGGDLPYDQLIDLGDFTIIIEQVDDTTIKITTYDEITDTTTEYITTTDI